MLSYCVVSTVFTPRVRMLRKGRVYTLGREPSCELPLPSEVVSRRHAEIEWSKNGFVLRDLGSRNGTRVNDERVKYWRQLKDGDKIWIGPFSLQYREYEGDISELLDEARADGETTMAIEQPEGLGPPKAPQKVAAGTGFAGHFSGSELIEICQLISLNEKTGLLQVASEKVSGEIAFRKGEIRRATAGPLEGEKAALAILELAKGHFEFTAGASELGKEPLKLKTDQVLLDALRRRDEAGTPLSASDSAPIPGKLDDATRGLVPEPLDPDETKPR